MVRSRQCHATPKERPSHHSWQHWLRLNSYKTQRSGTNFLNYTGTSNVSFISLFHISEHWQICALCVTSFSRHGPMSCKSTITCWTLGGAIKIKNVTQWKIGANLLVYIFGVVSGNVESAMTSTKMMLRKTIISTKMMPKKTISTNMLKRKYFLVTFQSFSKKNFFL